MFLNVFGLIRMQSNASRRVGMRSDNLRKVRVSFWNWGIFFNNLGSRGVLFQGFYVQEVYFFRGVLLEARINDYPQRNLP